MSAKVKNNPIGPIWYKFENRNANVIRELPGKELNDLCEEIKTKEQLQEAASTLILQVKKLTDTMIGEFSGKELIDLCEAIKTKSALNEPADSLILQVKQLTETEYNIILDADYFQNSCDNNFKKLINTFDIKRTNPIKVTLPDTQEIQRLRDHLAKLQIQEEPQGSTSSAIPTASTSATMAQAPSNEIWVRYNDRSISFKQSTLENMEISNVEGLIEHVKVKLRKDIENIYEKAIILRRGDEVLSSETSISGLYNTKGNALEVVIDEGALTINLIVKAPGNKEFYFANQHVQSSDEISNLIRGMEVLNPFLTEGTILLGINGEHLGPQHLETAQSSGSLSIILSEPAVDTGSEVQETLKEAFNFQFQDPNGMKEKVLLYLNRKYVTWKSNTNHCVPYSTIFQSSGYGKSRLVKEIAKDIPTIYLCLRDARSTGYPLRTSIGAYLFERVLGNLKEGEEWRFLYVLQNAIQCFKKELTNCNNNNEEFWNNQMDTEFCERIWAEIQRKSENWRSIVRKDVTHTANFIDDYAVNDRVGFLLCIDEARTLIPSTNNTSPFRLLRRALRKIKWDGFFVLLLDTLSRISNFSPPKSIDPSSRDTSESPLKLFYPYFRLTTMDIFKSNVYDNEFWNLAKFGRPLYISYLKSCEDESQAIDRLKNLLRRKLLGGANSFESSKQEISSLAILSSVIGLDMSPQSQLASELVASHMATCLSVSEDRERLIIAYPSEPLLSEVALEFMSDLMLPKILRLFSTSLKKGLVEPGPRGELVGRIILAVVAYKLRSLINESENSVKKFLSELYHQDSLPKFKDFSDEFINGKVAFTHFNVVNYVPEKEDLEKFYIRRCAFIMKRNHPGADICIPVRLISGRYSIIIIQIKNIDTTTTKADENYPASAKSMLNCNFIFEKSDLKDHNEPCLCLYWQLGYNYHFREEPSTISTRSGQLESNNLYWATFGLKHYKINGIADILNDILISYTSPFDSEWKVNNEEEGDTWDGDEIKIMYPLSYGKYEEKKKNDK